jgi:hypothetical protein
MPHFWHFSRHVACSPREPRDTDEACRALNVHTLHHAGALILGTTTHWQWPHPLTPIRASVCAAEASRIFVSINDGAEILVLIAWEQASVLLGGERPYFLCPGCARRTWHLYIKGQRLVCRTCGGLHYSCRHMSEWDLTLHRIAKLRRRLGAAPGVQSPLPPRPRHGRAKRVYDRLVAELAAHEAEALGKLDSTIAALKRVSKRGPRNVRRLRQRRKGGRSARS